jgi:hypothetical protein
VSEDGAPPTFLIMLFPFFFVGAWLVVSAILSEVSGWPALARRYPGGPRPEGKRLRGQVVGIGAVSENSVTVLIPTDRGLYMYAIVLFRFHHPPVMLPWSDVHYAGERKLAWWRWVVLDIGSIGASTTLRIRPRAYAAIEPYLAPRRDRTARVS